MVHKPVEVHNVTGGTLQDTLTHSTSHETTGIFDGVSAQAIHTPATETAPVQAPTHHTQNTDSSAVQSEAKTAVVSTSSSTQVSTASNNSTAPTTVSTTTATAQSQASLNTANGPPANASVSQASSNETVTSTTTPSSSADKSPSSPIQNADSPLDLLQTINTDLNAIATGTSPSPINVGSATLGGVLSITGVAVSFSGLTISGGAVTAGTVTITATGASLTLGGGVNSSIGAISGSYNIATKTFSLTLNTISINFSSFVNVSVGSASLTYNSTTSTTATIVNGTPTTQSLSLLTLGINDATVFFGINGPATAAGATGISITGANLALALMSTSDGSTTYYGLEASALSISPVGLPAGITISSTNLQILVNGSNNGSAAVNFNATFGGGGSTGGVLNGLSVATGGTPVVLNFTGQTLAASGTITLDFNGYVYISGTMAFQTQSNVSVTLSNSPTPVMMSELTIGASAVTVFVGMNGPASNTAATPVGVELSGVNLALALFTDATGNTYYGVNTSGGTLSAVGLPSGFQFTAGNLSVQVNGSNNNTGTNNTPVVVNFVASFGANGLPVSTGGTPSTIDLNYTTQYFAASGSITLDINGYVYISGTMAFEYSTGVSVTLTNGTTTSAVTMSELTIGASAVTVFVGMNGPDTNPKAVGVELTQVDFALAIFTGNTGNNVYYGVDSMGGTLQGVNLPGGISFVAGNLTVQLNGSTDPSNYVVNFVASFGTDGLAVSTGGTPATIDLNYTTQYFAASGTLTMNLDGYVYISGSMAFQSQPGVMVTLTNSSTPVALTELTVGASGMTVFVGMNGPATNMAQKPVGVELTGVNFALAMFSDAIGNVYYGVNTFGGTLEGVNLPGGFKFDAGNLTVQLNESNNGSTVVNFGDFNAGAGLSVPTGGTPATIVLNYTTQFFAASGTLTMDFDGYVYISGGMAFSYTNSVPVTLTNSPTPVALSELTIGAASLTVFVGMNGPATNSKAVGVELSGVNFAMAIFSDTTGNTYYGVNTYGGTLMALGLPSGFTFDAGALTVQLNDSNNDTGPNNTPVVVDFVTSFGANGLAVTTGGTPATIDLKYTTQYFAASGTLTLDVGGFVYITGSMAFSYTDSASVVLTNADGTSPQSAVNMTELTIGTSALTVFVGVNGPATNSNATGFQITGVNLALAIFTGANGDVYYGLSTTAASVGPVGLPTSITVNGGNLSVSVNSSNDPNNYVVDFNDFTTNSTPGLSVSTGSTTPAINLDTVGSLIAVSGTVDLGVSSYFDISGPFTFTETSGNIDITAGTDANPVTFKFGSYFTGTAVVSMDITPTTLTILEASVTFNGTMSIGPSGSPIISVTTLSASITDLSIDLASGAISGVTNSSGTLDPILTITAASASLFPGGSAISGTVSASTSLNEWIQGGSTYSGTSGSGTVTITNLAAGTYTWTPGANDTNLMIGGNTYTTTTTFTTTSTQTATLTGKAGMAVSGTLTTPPDGLGFQSSFDLSTGAFSITLEQTSLKVSSLMTATSSDVLLTYDPTNNLPHQQLVSIGTGSLTVNLSSSSSITGSVTSLVIYTDGFSIGTVTITYNGTLTLGPLSLTGPYVSLSNFAATFTSGNANFTETGTLTVGVTSASLNISPVTASVTGLTITVNLTPGTDFGAVTVMAGSINFTIASVLSISATNVTINTAPTSAASVSAATTASVYLSVSSATVSVTLGSLTLGGTATNFSVIDVSNSPQFDPGLPGDSSAPFGISITATPGQMGLPSWLGFSIQELAISWPDGLLADPTNFVITLSASINSISGLPDGVQVSGEITDAVINVGYLEAGMFPITSIGSVGGSVSGTLFGMEVNASFVMGIVSFNAENQLIENGNVYSLTLNNGVVTETQVTSSPDTTVSNSILYVGVSGGAKIPGVGGVQVYIGFSSLGPLTFYMSAEFPLILDPDTGIAIGGFSGGVTFDYSIPTPTQPSDLATLQISPAGLTISQWQQQLRDQTVLQYTASSGGTNLAAAYDQPFVIEAGITLYDAYLTADAFTITGNIAIQINPEDASNVKVFVTGVATFGTEVSFGADLYANIDVNGAATTVTFMFLFQEPAPPNSIETIGGSIMFGFTDANGNPITQPTSTPMTVSEWIPLSTSYDSTGAASLGTLPAGTYTWTPGTNDTSLTVNGTQYLASIAVHGVVSITTTGGTATLAGTANTAITGTVTSPATLTQWIAANASYSGGTYTTTSSLPVGTYTWTPGTNDTSVTINGITYLASSAVGGQLVIMTTAASTATFAGTGTTITGTLSSAPGVYTVTTFSAPPAVAGFYITVTGFAQFGYGSLNVTISGSVTLTVVSTTVSEWIPSSTTYTIGGTASLGTLAAGFYTWTPGSNDTSLTVGTTTYQADTAVGGIVTFTTTASASATLNGTASTAVVGKLTSAPPNGANNTVSLNYAKIDLSGDLNVSQLGDVAQATGEIVVDYSGGISKLEIYGVLKLSSGAGLAKLQTVGLYADGAVTFILNTTTSAQTVYLPSPTNPSVKADATPYGITDTQAFELIISGVTNGTFATLAYVPSSSEWIPSSTNYVSGSATISNLPAGTYVWVPGTDDTSLQVGTATAYEATGGPVIFSTTATETLTLTGTGNTAVNGTLTGGSAVLNMEVGLDLKISAANGLQLYADINQLTVGPSAAPFLTMNGYGLFVINAQGFAAEMDLNLGTAGAGSSGATNIPGITLNAHFTLVINTTSTDITYMIPSALPALTIPGTTVTVTQLLIPGGVPSGSQNWEAGLVYDGTGSATITNVAAGTYTWVPGSNETSLTVGGNAYTAADEVNGQVTITVIVNWPFTSSAAV